MAQKWLPTLPLTVYGGIFLVVAVAATQTQLQPYLIYTGFAFTLLAYGMLQAGMVSFSNLFNLKGIATLATFFGLMLFGLKLMIELGLGIILPGFDVLQIWHMYPLGSMLLAMAAVELKRK